MNYYNEIDKFAALWLAELVKAGHIPYGEIDTRSIEDVTPADLAGYTQCHFFAGIGGWSLALSLAGWPASRPVWTGSCPCQPFSAAGKGGGTADERHLWPAWHHLIRECRPSVVFGEQVEAAINHGWLDLVQDDLEGEGYAFGAVGLPAAGVGAPHIRQRVWFVADADGERCDRKRVRLQQRQSRQAGAEATRRGIDALADASGSRLQVGQESEDGRGDVRERREGRQAVAAERPETPWAGAIWERGADGMHRAIKPGLCVMADGVPGRVAAIRGYGNAIVPQVAAEVISAYLSSR